MDEYREADREALLALKCSVFGGTILENERRRFAWEFDRNPARDWGLPPALVVRDGGELVAGFTFVPSSVRVAGERVSGAAGIDLCVAASHRGQGLGRQVVEPFWAEGLCTFPFSTGVNPASLHLFSSCGATLLGGAEEVTLHAWFRDGAPTEPDEGEVRPVAVVEDIPADWDACWADLVVDHPLVLERDAASLRWRYVEFPFARPVVLAASDDDGRTCGLAVVQADPGLDRVYLLELLTAKDDAAAQRGLVAAALGLARESGLATLYYSTRRAEQQPILRAAGLQPVPGAYPTYMGKLNLPGASRPDAVSGWTVSLGDGDQLFNVGEPRPGDGPSPTML